MLLVFKFRSLIVVLYPAKKLDTSIANLAGSFVSLLMAFM